jgi:hypothetical protein
MMQRLLIPCLALVLTAACGKSAEQKQAEEAAQKVKEGAEQVAKAAEQAGKGAQAGGNELAQGLQQMAQGIQQMGNAQSVKIIDSDRLKELLPEIGGWERGTPKGEQVSMMGMATSKAEARYTKGDSRIDLEITDTSFSQAMLAPFSMFLAMGFEEKSDDGFKRAAKIGGSPGLEEWNKGTRRAEATAIVGGRYIVQGTGRGVDGLDVVRKAVEAVDLAKLAALK